MTKALTLIDISEYFLINKAFGIGRISHGAISYQNIRDMELAELFYAESTAQEIAKKMSEEIDE